MRTRGFVGKELLYLVAGLGIGFVAAGQFMPKKDDGVNFRSYKSGQYSKIDGYRTTIMETQGDFQRYWADNTGDDPSTAPSDVKWNEERLIAVNLGERNTSGYSVMVRSIKREQNNLIVTYVERQPPAGSRLLQVMTSPFEIIRLPRVAGHIRFEKKIDKGLNGIIVIDTGRGCGCDCGCKCCKNGHG